MKIYKVGGSEDSLQGNPEGNIIEVTERREGHWILSETWVVESGQRFPVALQDQCNA
jgi:hypothetical protein